MNWFDNAPRRVMAVVCLACVALLAFGMYLQHVVGLEPCPMCIVQRYALVLIAVCAGLTAASTRKSVQISGSVLLVLLACAGAFVAARQSWLQWYPLGGSIANWSFLWFGAMALVGSALVWRQARHH